MEKADEEKEREGQRIIEYMKNNVNDILSRSRATCQTLDEYTKGLTLGKNIGQGRDGVVYLMTDSQNREVAVKILAIDIKSEKGFDREVRSMKRFFECGIGVELYAHYKVDRLSKSNTIPKRIKGFGIIVMEKISDVLFKYLRDTPNIPKSFLDSIQRQLVMFIKVMQREHISHNDMHFHNIGFNIIHNGTDIELKLIDMGRAHDNKSFTDINILNIVRSLFDERLRAQPEVQEYLTGSVWPVMRDMFHDKRLCNIEQNYDTIRNMYLELYFKWTVYDRIRAIGNRQGKSNTQKLVDSIIRESTCVKNFERVFVHHGNNMVTVRKKEKDKSPYMTLKYARISDAWVKEREMYFDYATKVFGGSSKGMWCTNNEGWGVIIMDTVEGTLDEYLKARQYDMTFEELDEIGNYIYEFIIQWLDGESDMAYGQLEFSKIGYSFNTEGKIVLYLFDWSRALKTNNGDTRRIVLDTLSLGLSLCEHGRAYRYLKEEWWPQWKVNASGASDSIRLDRFEKFEDERKKLYDTLRGK